MVFYLSSSLTTTHFSKPLNPSKTLLLSIQSPTSLSSFVRRRKPKEAKLTSKFNLFPSRRNGLITCCTPSSSESSVSQEEEDAESNQLFERLRETGKERISNKEELERKANLQLERQLVMASDWSRMLLTMRGKLKGTEWDPETSHRINFSDFMKLLDSNSVQYMEYSNWPSISEDKDWWKSESSRSKRAVSRINRGSSKTSTGTSSRSNSDRSRRGLRDETK